MQKLANQILELLSPRKELTIISKELSRKGITRTTAINLKNSLKVLSSENEPLKARIQILIKKADKIIQRG